MIKWPLFFFIAAVIAGALGFSGVAAAATDLAVLAFFLFAVLFVISLIFTPRRAAGRAFGLVGGLLVFAAVAIVAIWASDNYSLETAGREADIALADARENLERAAEDLPQTAHDARENAADALDAAEDAVDPDDE